MLAEGAKLGGKRKRWESGKPNNVRWIGCGSGELYVRPSDKRSLLCAVVDSSLHPGVSSLHMRFTTCRELT